MIKTFYEKVLPTQGVYCASGIDKNGKITNRFAETFSDLLTVIDKLKGQKLNVYVAPGTFEGYSRKADDSIYFKSFFVDFDVRDFSTLPEEKKNKYYPNKEAAIEALEEFVQNQGLPEPAIVDSGVGVHAYWVLVETIPTSEWKLYAERFKALCMQHLKIDPTVTADASRIMRCPDSYNYRTDPPTHAKVLRGPVEIPFDTFKKILGEVQLEQSTADVLALIPKGLDDDTAKLKKLDNFEDRFDELVIKSIDGEGCAQVKYAAENPANVDYDTWTGVLSIAVRCVDGEEAIHMISEDHPEYNYDAVVKKANSFSGVRTCKDFIKNNPDRCGGCAHRGKITTPIQLARVFKTPEITEAQEDAIRSDEAGESEDQAPTFPAEFFIPFAQGVKGGVYYMPKAKTTKEGVKITPNPVMLFPNNLYAMKRMYSPLDGDCLLMKCEFPHDEAREFLIPMKTVYAQEEMTKSLTSNGIYFDTDSPKLVKEYIVKWAQYLQGKQAAEQMRMQFGYTDDKRGFVIGFREIRDDGTVVKAAPSPYIFSLAKHMAPTGSYEKWKEAANKLNLPTMEMHAFGLLCGFGSPLMWHTSTSGCVISFYGGSGNAKTGSMYAGLSVAGSPKEVSVFKGTPNAILNRQLGMHSLFFGFDEVTNRKPEEMSEFMHQVSNGKGKIRLTTTITERPMEASARMLAMVTANSSMYQKWTADNKANPDGEMARMIEFNLQKPQLLIDRPELGREIFNTFVTNYGHAIDDYIKYLFKLGHDEVRRRIDKWRLKFLSDYGADTANRFYEDSTAVNFAGGEIAIEAGIINLDLERIYRVYVANMISNRDNTYKLNQVDYGSLLGEFLNKNFQGLLVMNDSKMITEPRQSLVARHELQSHTTFISKTVLKQFLSERQISVAEFEFALKKEGLLTWVGKKRLASGWSAGHNSPPIYVYGFKSDGLVQDILNENSGT